MFPQLHVIVCSNHFSEHCFQLNPQILSSINFQQKVKRLLKEGAVPNVPIRDHEVGKDGGDNHVVQLPLPRGAFAKRQKAEVSFFTKIFHFAIHTSSQSVLVIVYRNTFSSPHWRTCLQVLQAIIRY